MVARHHLACLDMAEKMQCNDSYCKCKKQQSLEAINTALHQEKLSLPSQPWEAGASRTRQNRYQNKTPGPRASRHYGLPPSPLFFNSEGAVLKSHDPLGNKSSVAVNGPKRAEKSIISAVIDRSSSMTAIWANTVAGFDSFLESQKETEGDAVYSLRVFDHLQTTVYSFVPADEACTIPHTVKPRFGTALNDAIGQEIRRIRNFQMENPAYTSVVLLIMTDGMENASREFNTAQVRRLVQICQREEWQIIFMGANIDAFATGGTFGFTNTIQYDGPSLNASFVTAASSARSYRQSGRSSARSVDLTMQSGQP